MNTLMRHDMILPDAQGVKFARLSAQQYSPCLSKTQIDTIIAPGIPGIVRRQERSHANEIELGFSSPFKEDGMRLRAACAIPLACIMQVVTPFDVMAHADQADTQPQTVLQALRHMGALCGIEIGVYGSLALWLVSGLPYFTADSDYDIYIRKRDTHADVRGFYEQSRQLAQSEQIRLDIEIDCGNGFAAKLAELFSAQKTVLCKGLYAVELRRIDTLGDLRGDL